MADRIAANANDLAVDELKRKARRRLIGAIVIALAAAVILPLLLEKEQKPLGDDVSVQIPPVDEGKFVNRLTGRSGDSKSNAKFGAKADAKADAKVDASKAEPTPAAAPAPVAASVPAPPPAPDTAPATTTTAPVAAAAPASSNGLPKQSHAEAEQRVLMPNSKAAAKSDAKPVAPTSEAKPPAPAVVAAPTPVEATPAPAPPSTPVPAAASTKPEGFAVQIAAFTDDKGANALAAKLKKAGYASSYIEPVETSRGTLWRVRVGGFASRPDADAARTKLKADGWNGLVVAAK